MSKYLDQILLSIKLNKNWLFGVKVEEDKEKKGKEKLISIGKWLDEFKPKSEWAS